MKCVIIKKDDIQIINDINKIEADILTNCKMIYKDNNVEIWMNNFKVCIIGSTITIYYVGTKEYEFFKKRYNRSFY